MINRDWKIPWRAIEIMKEVKDIMGELNIHVNHIYREANQLADLIANIAINQVEKLQFNSFIQLPTAAKMILNMDKHQVPSLRIRTRRFNIHNH